MKIMFVVLSLGKGGAERVVSVLANSFVDLHHEVVMVFTSNHKICYQISEQIKIKYLEDEWNINQGAFHRVFRRIQAIRKAIQSEKPDIVISFLSLVNMETAIALMNCNIPLIVSERSNPAVVPSDRMRRLLRRIVYHRPNGFVFQTEQAKQYFSKQIQKKSAIILNPLMSGLPVAFSGERTKRIVSVGRLVKEKNYPLLLEAFEKFHKIKPEYILEIYGEGDQEDNIRRIIKEKELTDYVRLMGYCRDVHERINDASMFVMSSNYEGMPNALMEAMAQGLPCISTDCPCGGPQTLIKHQMNGLLVKVGDAEGLAKAMFDILEIPLYKELGDKAKAVRTIADPQVVTDKWMEYISEVINRG